MIVIDALRKLGPNATAARLRSYIAGLANFPGISGIYNYPAVPQRGLGVDDAVITRWNAQAKSFDWVSAPGGALLASASAKAAR